MDKQWIARVGRYVDRSEQLAEQINELLDELRIDIVGTQRQQPTADTISLRAIVEQLELLVVERDRLLSADDAPTPGRTLGQKLLATRQIDNARLAKRCAESTQALTSTHQRAVSLYVCQARLAGLGGELSRRVAEDSTGSDPASIDGASRRAA